MTPLEYAEKYRNLEVYVIPLDEAGSGDGPTIPAGAWKRTRVASYRLGDSAYRERFFDSIRKHIGKEGLAVMVKTTDGTTSTAIFLTRDEVWQHFRHPFVGKGTPEQVQLAIQLTYRFYKTGAVFSDLDRFTAASFLGLDCNGFAGNYIQRGHGTSAGLWSKPGNYADPGPNSSMSTLMRLPGNQVLAAMEEILAGTQDIYILAMCDPSSGLITERNKTTTVEGKEETSHGHIMLTEPGTVEAAGSEIKVKVVESTGGKGLVDSEYRILKVAKARDRPKEGIFRVFRGSKGEEMSVKIARLA
ncbi:MAG: hypothetical protein IANPNBLG_04504 [Bryobacteraceae bacterium]|nr:hypothetical protein [Bryobacteraceae bacterium]